jgi:thioester reductase-like protein
MLDFCASLPQPVTIMFTSSISVAGKWDVACGPVPEQPIMDPEVASSTGYSSSKYVTEQVSTHSAEYEIGLIFSSLASGEGF